MTETGEEYETKAPHHIALKSIAIETMGEEKRDDTNTDQHHSELVLLISDRVNFGINTQTRYEWLVPISGQILI